MLNNINKVPMEDNKYYTPEIEEFHVGFEFESKYVLFSSEREWSKAVLNEDTNWFWQEYDEDAIETEFRVKYLDREDIESLGWKFEQTAHGADHFGKGTHKLADGRDGKIKIFATNIRGGIVCIFMGTLRNKSELINLLKQLGLWVKII